MTEDPHLTRAHRVLSNTPLVDGHNDLPWAIRKWYDEKGQQGEYDLRGRTTGHTDLERLAQGRVGAQLWSVYIPCQLKGQEATKLQMEQIAVAKDLIRGHPETFAEAQTASEIRRAFDANRIGSMIAMEGGQVIDSLDALRSYFALGVRSLTLTHNCSHDWADAALDEPRNHGLSPFGRQVVQEMNRLGMIVDLSHASDATVRDAMSTSRAPLFWTHAGARKLVGHPRNVPDEVLRFLPRNGGIVMVTFVPAFVNPAHRQWDAEESRVRKNLEARHGRRKRRVREELEAWRAENPPPPAQLSQVADHIEHIRRVAGTDHVGLGSDFDGITRVVEGLEDVSTYPALLAELSRRGWNDQELAKLIGENALRAIGQVEEVARRIQLETGD